MKPRLLFATSNDFWGGSEVLWYKAAQRLTHDCQISFIGNEKVSATDYIRELPSQGIDVHGYGMYRKTPVLNRFIHADRQVRSILEKVKPSLVIISLGSHSQIGPLPKFCLSMGIPYAFVFQLVNDERWVETESTWLEYRASLLGAAACYFVSDANQAAIEKMIASKLPNARRIHNPFQVDLAAPFSYPPDGSVYKLANVARYMTGDKGQDILLEVLSQPKWKEGNIEIHLVGSGSCKQLFHELIKFYGLKNVFVTGYRDDIGKLWSEFHGLLLPSRREGSSLAMMEALVMGRVVISTAVGSATELIKDNENGFIARYAKAEFLDDAMERAWTRRHEWHQMGEKNYHMSREIFKTDPIEAFTNQLRSLL